MKTISSRQTFFVKRIFPAFWFGIIGVVAVGMAVQGAFRQMPALVLHPLFMAGIGYVVMRQLVWDLADEVRDAGDALLVRKGGIEERIALRDVMNVSVTRLTNPRRVALRLRRPGKLGDEIAFIPIRSRTWNPFARDPLAEDLILRIDRLRMPAGA